MKNTLQLFTLIGLLSMAPVYAMETAGQSNIEPQDPSIGVTKLFVLYDKLIDRYEQLIKLHQQSAENNRATKFIHGRSNARTIQDDAMQLEIEISQDRKSAQAQHVEGGKDIIVTLDDCNDEDLKNINSQIDQFIGEMPIAQSQPKSSPQPKKVYKFIHDMDAVDNRIQDEMSIDAAIIAETMVVDSENIRKREKFEKEQQKIVNAVEQLAEEIMKPQQSKLTARNAGITTAILAVVGTGTYAAKTVSFEKAKVKFAGLRSRLKKSFARAA